MDELGTAPLGTRLPISAAWDNAGWEPLGYLAGPLETAPEPERPRDIVDEIDALVDEQLAGYADRSGYDFNVGQDACWHCGEDWHGLAITERMQEMRRRATFDESYRYASDESEVLCPGSDFIGPWATREQLRRIREGWDLPWARRWELPADPFPGFRQRWIIGDGPSMIAGPDFQVGYHLPTETAPPEEQFPREAPRSSRYEYLRLLLQQARRLAADTDSPSATYQHLRLERGDRIAYEVDGVVRDVGVIVDVIEGENGEVTYTTQDPRFSAGAQQLATLRDRRREAGLPNHADPMEWFERILTWPNELSVRVGGHLPSWMTTSPEPETPQQRALPRPSTTPPMWANNPTRTNRRRNR